MGQVGSQSICGNCGTANAAGEQFCGNSGYSLAGGPTGPNFSGPTIDSSTAPTAISSGAPTLIGSNAPTVVGSGSGMRRTTGALIAGNLLEGRYRVVRLVGKGGFGAVYEARDERFQAKRIVAIKEMSDGHLTPAERAQAIADFRQEADLLVQLKHPNLPDVSDFFEEGDKAYLVMEYIEGKTLEKEQEDAGEGIKVFTIAYGSDADVSGLSAIANATGGQEYAGTPQNIRQVYLQISEFF